MPTQTKWRRQPVHVITAVPLKQYFWSDWKLTPGMVLLLTPGWLVPIALLLRFKMLLGSVITACDLCIVAVAVMEPIITNLRRRRFVKPRSWYLAALGSGLGTLALSSLAMDQHPAMQAGLYQTGFLLLFITPALTALYARLYGFTLRQMKPVGSLAAWAFIIEIGLSQLRSVPLTMVALMSIFVSVLLAGRIGYLEYRTANP